MTRKEKLAFAIVEAERFLERARLALGEAVQDDFWECTASKIQASAKRASIDLTRSLADLRKREGE